MDIDPFAMQVSVYGALFTLIDTNRGANTACWTCREVKKRDTSHSPSGAALQPWYPDSNPPAKAEICLLGLEVLEPVVYWRCQISHSDRYHLPSDGPSTHRFQIEVRICRGVMAPCQIWITCEGTIIRHVFFQSSSSSWPVMQHGESREGFGWIVVVVVVVGGGCNERVMSSTCPGMWTSSLPGNRQCETVSLHTVSPRSRFSSELLFMAGRCF